MRSFVALDVLIGSVPFDLVHDLRAIDTGRGSEALYRDKLPALLTSLAQRARVASVAKLNRRNALTLASGGRLTPP